jgi:hypothetical protein
MAVDPQNTGIDIPYIVLRLASTLSVSTIICSYFCVIVIWLNAILRRSLITKFPKVVTGILLGFAGLQLSVCALFLVVAYLTDAYKYITYNVYWNSSLGLIVEILFAVCYTKPNRLVLFTQYRSSSESFGTK